jgi:hypothetical protein
LRTGKPREHISSDYLATRRNRAECTEGRASQKWGLIRFWIRSGDVEILIGANARQDAKEKKSDESSGFLDNYLPVLDSAHLVNWHRAISDILVFDW